MIAEFCVIPVGGGTHFSGRLAKILRLVDASGLDYKLGPMGTCVEGSWEEVMALIDKCRRAVLSDHQRVWISIKVDDRKGSPRKKRLSAKVDSVVEKSGRCLKT